MDVWLQSNCYNTSMSITETNRTKSTYKTGHATETALLSIKNEVYLSLSTFLILLNLTAAFDKIDHSTLSVVFRLSLELRCSVLKWSTSYLTEYYQSINISSTLIFVNSYLVGPMLSLFYTTPLSLVIGKHKGIKFHFYAMTLKFMSIYHRINLLPLNS